MIVYLMLSSETACALNSEIESIIHRFTTHTRTYAMFDVNGVNAGYNFFETNSISKEQYWKAYGENKPMLEWKASPFLRDGKVRYKMSLTESYLFEILKATGAIIKDHCKIYTGKDADGLILQTTEPSIICLKNNAILTEKELYMLTQVLQDMKTDILMAYDNALREIHHVSLLNNHFVL